MFKHYRKHWIVAVLMCCLCGVSIGICQNTIGVFYAPISESTGILRGTVAMHTTVAMVIANILGLFVPRFVTEKNFKGVLTAGMILAAGASFLLGHCTEAWQFIACGALRGIGAACLGLVLITMILNRWFAKSLGLVTSFVFGTSGLVGSIGSWLLNMVNENFGWQMGFTVTAIAIIALALPAILYPFTMSPENCGLTAYGIQDGSEAEDTSKKYVTGGFHSIQFAVIFIISVAGNYCTSLPQHFPGYAQSLGFTAAAGAFLLSINMAFNIIGKITAGELEKKTGSIITGLICLSLTFVGVLLVLNGSSVLVLDLGAVFFGFIYVLTTISLVTLTKASFGREKYSEYYPIIQFAGGVTNALALPVTGYLYDFTGSYRPAFLIAEGMIILMAVLLVMMKKKQQTA